MRFALLGPLEVRDDAGNAVTPAGVRQRSLIACLLVHANMPVPRDALIDTAWDGRRAGGPTMVRSVVMRLRRELGADIGGRIVTCPTGYLIRVDESELDILRFEALCAAAGPALRNRDWTAAAQAAAAALELWRGEPLLDVASDLLREQTVSRFERLRIQVLEDGIEAELHLGPAERLVPRLRDLTADHPLRERFHGQLMTALAGCGRRAEALAAYQDARKALVTELGLEPGPELRALHERILGGGLEPDADGAPGAATLATETAPEKTPSVSIAGSPRQLPAAPLHFTGRRAELDLLTALARRTRDEAASDGATVVISAIDGMAGIGKTALAVRTAHRVAAAYPHGQLFIDLHGHTAGHPPREPGEALEAFLRALNVPAQRIPADLDERAALYRQQLADTRTLILLDNAADEAQVRPLLPGAPGCLVLVTSRRRLKGLDDAHSVPLDLLPAEDAAALLRAVAGPGRIAADALLLDEIAHLCGRLPVALRIAGSLLRHRPAWDLEHLARLLRDQHRRVPSLSDGERDLATVFDLSCAGLDEQHGLLLRRLSVAPGPDADAYAAAALLACDPDTAAGLLEDLVDHNLLITHTPDRYRLHDLLRAYARARADQDAADERDSAVDRLLHYYAHTAQSASVVIARYPRPAPDGPAPAHSPVLTAPERARAWLRAERDNLEAASAHAHMLGLDRHAVALAAGLAEILLVDGPFTRALELHHAAAETAERRGWPTAHAAALADLGRVRRLTGDLPGATDAAIQALEIFRSIGDRLGEAYALTNLGIVRQYTGDLHGSGDALTGALKIFEESGQQGGEGYALTELGHVRYLTGDLPGADDALTRALEIFRLIGHQNGEAYACTELGRLRRMVGDLPAAADALTRAREICRAIGHHGGEASALADLGIVRLQTGDLPGAGDALAQALEICRAIGHRHGEAYALTMLGRVRYLSGDLPGAGDALARALEICRMAGNRGNGAWALNYYAATVAATGDLAQAFTLYRRALAMNRELDKPANEALALEGLGTCHLSVGELEPATGHLEQALEIFERLGMSPDVERVRTLLAQSYVA